MTRPRDELSALADDAQGTESAEGANDVAATLFCILACVEDYNPGAPLRKAIARHLAGAYVLASDVALRALYARGIVTLLRAEPLPTGSPDETVQAFEARKKTGAYAERLEGDPATS